MSEDAKIESIDNSGLVSQAVTAAESFIVQANEFDKTLRETVNRLTIEKAQLQDQISLINLNLTEKYIELQKADKKIADLESQLARKSPCDDDPVDVRAEHNPKKAKTYDVEAL
jgi:hypothetical protein